MSPVEEDDEDRNAKRAKVDVVVDDVKLESNIMDAFFRGGFSRPKILSVPLSVSMSIRIFGRAEQNSWVCSCKISG